MPGKKPKRGRARRAKPGLAAPPNWKVDAGGKSWSLRVETKDFLEAVSLINAIAPIAEEIEHHPDFHLERWNQLTVTTYSHDVGRLTERDLRLALRVNEVLARRHG